MPNAISEQPSPLRYRIAIGSILCFWFFYFAIWSLRAAVLYEQQASMLGIRAIVSLFSAGVTMGVYLVMHRMNPARLSHSIAAALLLSLPAAALYSSFNWYMFDHREALARAQSPTPASAPSMNVGTMPAGPDEAMTPAAAIAEQAANGYFFFIAWTALYLALRYAAEIGALERRAAALSAAAQAAELRALRYQINPHFLFNTLNSLSSLVMSGKQSQAERMIINLSSFFRTSLSGDPTEDVRLSEELELQRLYLAIEQVRFPDRLRCDIDVPDELRCACVPGLILQPLVENAVKYAVARARRPVTIRIAAREIAGRLALAVEDDGDPVAEGTGDSGTGVGLRNVGDRLAARFNDAATCAWNANPGGGFLVSLTMPLVRDEC